MVHIKQGIETETTGAECWAREPRLFPRDRRSRRAAAISLVFLFFASFGVCATSAPARSLLSENAARALEEFGLYDLAKPPAPSSILQDEATSLALHVRVLCLRAHYLMLKGKVTKARDLLEEAASICPDNYGIRLSLAEIEHRTLNEGKAVQICDELIAAHPERIEAYQLKGRIYEDTGQVAKAMEAYKKVLDKWPACNDVIRRLLRLALGRGNLDLVIEICKKRLEREPRHFQTLWWLAYVYDIKAQEKNDPALYRESAKYYEAALESRPDATKLYLRLGRVYLRLGNRDKAVSALRRGIIADSTDREIRRAFEDLVSPEGEDEEILAAYRSLADEYPNSTDIQKLYADQLLARGKYHEARRQFERLLSLEPTNVKVLLELGKLDLRERDWDKAKAHFERAVSIAGEDVDVYQEIGNAYLDADRYGKAVALFNKVLEREPKRVAAYFALAQAYQQMDELDKAAEVLRRGLAAVEKQKSRKPLLLALSTIEQQRGNFADAVALLRQAYDIDRTDMITFFRLGNLLLTMGDDESFKELLQQGRATFRRRMDIFQETLVFLLMDFHRYNEVIPELRSLIERHPDQWRYYASLATAYQRLRQAANGERLFDEARDRLGDTPDFYRFAERYYTLNYRHQEAADAIRKLIEISTVPRAKETADEWFALYGSLIYHLGRLKKYDEIGRVLERAERELGKIDPKQMRMLRARALAEMKHYDEAVAIYREMLKESPDDPSLYYELGAVLNEAGRNTEAEKALRKCLALLPRLPRDPEKRDLRATVLNHLGYMFVEDGVKLDEAEKLLDEALKLNPRAGFIIDSKGWLEYKLGRYDEAVRLLKKAADYSSEDPTIYSHLGDAYAKAGQNKKALEYWQKALRLDPSLQDVKAKIEKISKNSAR